jgi:hypothetical protein
MKRNLYLGIILLLFSVFFAGGQAFGAKSLLDDFSGSYIDSAKWRNGELVREVVNEMLVSKIGNDAYTYQGRNNTPFQNPSSINSIQCDITVIETKLDSGTDPRSFARIDGRFYNTNTANPTTHKGDVWAAVFIGNRGSGLEAWWEIHESSDDTGDSWEDRGHGTLDVLGLTSGVPYTTKLEYDGTNQFTFTVGTVSGVVFGPARQGAEFHAYKGLETGVYSAGGSGIGYASALFDNVFVNNNPYDDFSTGALEPTNWQALEFVREISAGKLRLNVQADEALGRAYVEPIYQTTPYLEAKVLVETGSEVSGAIGRARVRGFYYNDSRGPGSGQDYNGRVGDVFGYTAIRLDDGSPLSAMALILRCEDADCSTSAVVDSYAFATPISFDQEHTFSNEFTGSSLIFTCDAETYTYDIATPTYPPSMGQERRLESWVSPDPGGSGYMKATFDDVYTGYTAQATYDATGTWDVTETDVWSSCDPDAQPETSTITITQTGNDITLVDEDGNTFTGTVSGTYNNLYGEFSEQGGKRRISVTFSLSSSTSGNGLYYWTWTDGDIWCEGAGAFSFTKQAGPAPAGGGGGGGGCFIDTAGSDFHR